MFVIITLFTAYKPEPQDHQHRWIPNEAVFSCLRATAVVNYSNGPITKHKIKIHIVFVTLRVIQRNSSQSS